MQKGEEETGENGRINSDILELLKRANNGINVKDAKGLALLHYAAMENDIDAVELLLDRGANMNITDSAGITPLLHALVKNCHQTAEHLMRRLADVNRFTPYGSSPLAAAIINQDYSLILRLIGCKAKVHLTIHGFSYLYYALMYEKNQAAWLMARAGVHVLVYDILHAIEKGSHSLFEKLYSLTDINYKFGDNFTVIHFVAWKEKWNLIELCVRLGAEVNAITLSRLTPLHVASIYGSYNSAVELVKCGADLNPKSQLGHTPLAYADQFGDKRLTKYLIAKGAHY